MAFVLSPFRSFSSSSSNFVSSVHSRPSTSLKQRAPVSFVKTRRSVLPCMSLSVGSPAVEFSLPITDGSTLTLGDLFAKAKTVVVYFYPKDATPGCTTEAKDFRDMKSELDALGVAVVGVSRDTVDSHDSFSKDLDLNFPLISDDGTLSEGYGVWKLKKFGDKEFMAIERSTFVLQDGKVIKEWRGVKSGGHAAAVLEFLKSM